MENMLELKGVSKDYVGFSLKDINLTIPKGCVMGLVGENGAGKTTIMKIILNEINKKTGSIKIMGLDHIQKEKEIKEQLGVVWDDSFLSEYLTPIAVGKIMKNFYKNWDEKLYEQYLQTFQLPKNKMIKEFSSGMKMKLKIITAMSHHPQLLLLDEPTSGLDPVVRYEILDIFREFITDEQKAILISTHITSDLEHLADYITFVKNGQIILSKEKDILLEQYGIYRCTKEEFEKIENQDYVYYKKNKYEYDVLVEDKQIFQRKYQVEALDKPTIEEMMIICSKGEVKK
ncbi:MAG: ABC transporter ATP-binding protein [Clostridia bacterium]